MKTTTFFLSFFWLLLTVSASAQDNTNIDLESQKKQIQEKINASFNPNARLFEKNSNQYSSDFEYRLSSANACIDFYGDEIKFSLRQLKEAPDFKREEPKPLFDYTNWSIELIGSNTSQIQPEGLKEDKGVNYFDKSGKRIRKKVAEAILYKDVYANIDLRFYLNEEGQLKYDFILHPGAKVSDIRLKYKDVKDIEINSDGSLAYLTTWGQVKEEAPYSYFSADRNEAIITYALDGDILYFQSEHDVVTKELIIDPIYVDWSTYFYGDGYSTVGYAWTWILDLDIDDSSNLYVTGMTSDRFPVQDDSYDTSQNGYYDAFICKVTPAGDSLLWFNYIGGASYEYSFTLTVNDDQEPVMAGFTYSADFPITSGVFMESKPTGFYYTGFVTKLTSAGDSLIYSTYFGGSGHDLIHSMALDASGNVYVTGETSSTDFPTTSNCFQSSYGGNTSTGWWYGGDAFLAKINSDGTSLLYASYIGGAGQDAAYEIALSPSNEIYLVGKTGSGNFPITPGSSIFNYNVQGTTDGFVMKFKTDMKTLVYSKMMGGSGEDWFESIYVNKFDEAYIAGISASSDFYTTSNAYQKNSAGGTDFVVVKMNKLGQNVVYSTYIGGSSDEKYYSGWIYNSNVSISANVREEAIICGITRSNDFPVTGDALMTSNPSSTGAGGWWNTSATITKLDFLGAKLLYGTYYGGSSYEIPGANKLKRTSCYTNILYGGITASADYPTTAGSFRSSKSSGGTGGYFWTGFISKFRDTLYTDLVQLSSEDTLIECDNVFEIMDAKNQGADILWNDGFTQRYRIIKDTGTYWVRATYGCDTVRDTIHFILEYSPTVPVLPNDSTYCDDFPDIELDAQHDTILASYMWNSGDTSQKITVSSEGKYWVDIITPNCGTKTDTINYILRDTPEPILPEDSIFCDEVDIELVVGQAANDELYVWNTGDSVKSIVVDDTGYYKVIVSNFCGADSAEFNASLLRTPQMQLPNDTTFCDQVSYVLRVKDTADNSENYLWTDIDDGVIIGFSDSIKVTKSSLYKVDAINKCGSSSDSINISILHTPTLELGEDSIYCDVINTILKGGDSENKEAYTWSTGATVDSIQVTDKGEYWLSISNICGAISDTVEFIERISPEATITAQDFGKLNDTIFCDKIDLVLNASFNDPEAEYLWNTTDETPTLTVQNPGKYWVEVSNHCGTAVAELDLGLLLSPTVELGPERVFCGTMGTVDLSVGKTDNNEIYLWSGGGTSSSNTITTEGKHWVQISNKCAIVSDTLFTRVSPYPMVSLGPDTTLCGDFELRLDAGNTGMSYLWMPYGETTQQIIATEQIEYSVTVTNSDNCSSSDNFEVLPDCISHVHIPTAFSPNFDNINDVYKPTLINYQDYTIRIYNRWGELVFESNDVDRGWDGTYQGVDAPQGVYLYYISFTTTEEMLKRSYKGVLHLLR
ncbi:T9SS type B sorting domain-containing protein [bacterium]|nr:T9SS type B sorting domain-containing protein [bacterium]